MCKNKMFFEELDKVTQDNYKEVVNALIKQNTKVYSFSYLIELNDDIILKYNLNNDIKFKCVVTPDSGSMEHYYKGRLVKPINLYIRPDNYCEVSTLTILQECIKQDRHDPDIRYLELGGRKAKLKRILNK